MIIWKKNASVSWWLRRFLSCGQYFMKTLWTFLILSFPSPFISLSLALSHLPAGGLTELVGKFHNSRPMYGLCRVGLTETGQPQIVMVCWVSSHEESECLCQFISAIKNVCRHTTLKCSGWVLSALHKLQIDNILHFSWKVCLSSSIGVLQTFVALLTNTSGWGHFALFWLDVRTLYLVPIGCCHGVWAWSGSSLVGAAASWNGPYLSGGCEAAVDEKCQWLHFTKELWPSDFSNWRSSNTDEKKHSGNLSNIHRGSGC